jgi:hypothetical protein
MFSNVFFENRTVFEITLNNTEEPGRPKMTKWRMRVVCWVSKVTNTHSKYVIRIDFQLERWLCESASMLRYKYIACLVVLLFSIFRDQTELINNGGIIIKYYVCSFLFLC